MRVVGNFDQEEWIEGTGSTLGLFYSGYDPFPIEAEGRPVLICHEKNGELLYLDDRFTSCPTTILGIGNLPSNQPLPTFFNPTTQSIHLTWQEPLSKEVKVEIFNLLGQQVAKSEVAAGAQTATVQLPSLPSGIYIYRVSQNGEVVGSGKLVKH